jgi:hypothetical protein
MNRAEVAAPCAHEAWSVDAAGQPTRCADCDAPMPPIVDAPGLAPFEVAEVDAILAEFAGGTPRVRVAVKLGLLRKLRADLDPIKTLDGLKKLWRTGVETGRILATAGAADAGCRLSPMETARANRVLDDMAPPLLAAKWGEFERAAIVRAMLMYGDIVAADRTDMAAADVAAEPVA